MNGWRRPWRERLLSESEPTSGSQAESTTRVSMATNPACEPERPQRALR